MKILVVGAFNYGNIGDDTIRDVEVEFFKSQGHDVKWASPPMNVEDVTWCDALILGGGGILYDGDMANVLNYVMFLEEAKHQGKRFALCNIGTQGIHTEDGKRLYKILDDAKMITVRDPYDAYVLSRITTAPIEVAEDSAWAVEYPTYNQTSNLVVAVRGYKTMSWDPEKYKPLLDKIVQSVNVEVVCFSKEDKPFLKQFGFPVVEAQNLRNMNSVISGNAVLCMRFHPMIFAISTNRIPIVVVEDFHRLDKIARLAKRLQLPYVFEYGPSLYERITASRNGFSEKEYLMWITKQMKMKAIDGMNRALTSLY